MNTSTFRGILAAFALFVGLAFGLTMTSSVAHAQTAQSTTTNPTAPTTSCGTICDNTTRWTIAGGAASGGVGESTYFGASGTNKVEKRGWSLVDITANGSGCATINCTNGASSFSAMLKAGEEVNTVTTAVGNTSGEKVSAVNGSQAMGLVQLQVQLLQGATSAPSTHTAD